MAVYLPPRYPTSSDPPTSQALRPLYRLRIISAANLDYVGIKQEASLINGSGNGNSNGDCRMKGKQQNLGVYNALDGL